MIDIEEEPTAENGESAEEQTWTEEFTIAGFDLIATIKNLVREVTIRHIEIRDKNGKTLLEIPLALGVVGVAFLNIWTSLALIAAWIAELSILVVRAEPPVDEGEEIEIIFSEDAGDFDIEVGEPLPDEEEEIPVKAGPVNINTAGLAELTSLPGIAEGMAQRILDYRAAHGPFADISALTGVSGIGKAKLEQLAGLITV